MDPAFETLPQDGQSLPVTFDINPYGYWRLMQDAPDKRRKVYLELNVASVEALRKELQDFHVTLDDFKCLRSKNGLRCLLTATAQGLRQWLQGSCSIVAARVDLREYVMLAPPMPVTGPD